MTGRRLVGNLDAEQELAASLGDGASLPPRVVARVAAAATLLRAYAEPGDELWTPAPVDPRRLVPVQGLQRPRLVHGALPDRADGVDTLAWCLTPRTERLGARSLAAPEEPVSAALVSRVNHRGFFLELAQELGRALPGACLVSSTVELERHLAAGGAAVSPGAEWVLKPPLSAAGRGHIRGRGTSVSASVRSRIDAGLAAQGRLLFEPWVERVADFGWLGVVTGDGVRALGVHELVVQDDGRFRGVRVPLREPRLGVDEATAIDDVRAELDAIGPRVGERLSSAGYRGPFGIDAYTHRAAGGALALQPLGELNARLTFGFVARALVARAGAVGDFADGTSCTLRFASSSEPVTPRDDVVPLLDPDVAADGAARDDTVAWLELA